MPLNKAQRSVAIASAALATLAAPARAEVPHVVQPGETLWSIAVSNNFTTRTIAAYNGLAEDAQVYAGETIQVPSESEGAAALASAGGGSASPSAPIAGSPSQAPPALPPPQSPPYWTLPIYCPSCPSGQAYLASNAAAAWNAMRQESLRLYGIDLYPLGPLSAYRSYAQQLYLYELYLSGQGNLAAEPGTSSHEYGVAVDLADPSMRTVVDRIGAPYGWAKTEAPGEWWHVTYVGG
ncbi:MAG TPA: LysM peptidoglycan-binding domain-containing protein [Solirubrobacterales bacterium]|nr:LysM peptidoglycan-binding domain-containing protein [Solirubrobacterales bacterium]